MLEMQREGVTGELALPVVGKFGIGYSLFILRCDRVNFFRLEGNWSSHRAFAAPLGKGG